MHWARKHLTITNYTKNDWWWDHIYHWFGRLRRLVVDISSHVFVLKSVPTFSTPAFFFLRRRRQFKSIKSPHPRCHSMSGGGWVVWLACEHWEYHMYWISRWWQWGTNGVHLVGLRVGEGWGTTRATKETSYGFAPYGFGCVGWKVGKKGATCTRAFWANMCVECALSIGYYGPLIFSCHSTTHALEIHNKG